MHKVFSLVSGDTGPDTPEKVLLREVLKEISQNKYAKLYLSKTEELDPSCVAFLYSTYKTLYPARVFFREPEKSVHINQLIIEHFIDKTLLETARGLSPEAIAVRAKTAVPADLARQLQGDLAALASAFDGNRRALADRCRTLITALGSLALFDYIGMLQKFDHSLQDGIFTSPPKFIPQKAAAFVDEIDTFLSLIPAAHTGDDWKTALELLAACNGGADVIPPAVWNGLLVSLRDLKHSKILERIIQHATKNPVWVAKVPAADDHLVEAWYEEQKAEVERVVGDIAEDQRRKQTDALWQALFGGPHVTGLSYYTEEKSRIYTQVKLRGFIYAPALNALTVFIQDYFKKEIHELCDILLIRGQWTSANGSRHMSEGFHTVLDGTDALFALDETLSDKGSIGARLKASLLRVADRGQARYINGIIDSVNEEALELIKPLVQSLIVVGKYLKSLWDDSQKKPPELIINWKELSYFSKTPLSPRIAEAYKKLYYFVRLMALLTRSGREA
ncbi:hypothetical protein FACS189468_3690 [Spirochaetia bacterium]|nr:hypothetical protein FACS189468_3690 [Spirochaetia bacterium]